MSRKQRLSTCWPSALFPDGLTSSPFSALVLVSLPNWPLTILCVVFAFSLCLYSSYDLLWRRPENLEWNRWIPRRAQGVSAIKPHPWLSWQQTSFILRFREDDVRHPSGDPRFTRNRYHLRLLVPFMAQSFSQWVCWSWHVSRQLFPFTKVSFQVFCHFWLFDGYDILKTLVYFCQGHSRFLL